MRFDQFVGPSYTLSSINTASERCLNWYPEVIEGQTEKNRIALVRTPGLQLFATLPRSPVRGLWPGAGRLFAAGGDHLYEVCSNGNTIDHGFIGNDGNPVQMFPNGTQLFVVSNGLGWIDTGAGVVPANFQTAGTQIPAFQGAFLDGSFLVSKPLTNVCYYSALNDGTTWPDLNTFTKQAYPDSINGLQADHEELYIFGSLESAEVFRNTGDALNPYQRDPGAIMQFACLSPFSIARLGEGVAWIGGDVRRGERMAFYAVGYRPQRISTSNVEIAWAGYSTIADAVAYTYIDRGHQFWVINFPSGNATWVYDVTSGWWHERGWWNGASWDRQRQAFHAVVAYANSSACGNAVPGSTVDKHYVGDWQNGKIYIQSETYLDDNGTAIYRLRRAPHLTTENLRRFYGRFELDLDVLGLQRVYWNRLGYGRDRIWQVQTNQVAGAGVTLMLQWSDDRGTTWHSRTPITLDPSVDVSLVNAYLQYDQGTS